MWKKIKPYILPYSVAIAIPIAVGLLSAALTYKDMNVYDTLKTPPLAPPGALFPIVWTILYILMGVSSVLVYFRRDESPAEANHALKIYGLSLLFNFGWSILFFKLQAALFAFIWLIGLFCLVLKTIFEYYKLSKPAAYLQIPYAVWIAFAGCLNAGIWLLN